MRHPQNFFPQEGFFRSVVEQAAEMIAVVGRDGAIVYANPRTAEALGFAPGELIGRTLFELVHEDDRARLIELFDLELEVPDARFSFAVKLRSQDGTWRQVDARGRGLADSPDGGIVFSLRDVTVPDRRGRVVRRRAMDSISGYVRLDSEGRVLVCNPAFVRIFGFSSDTEAREADFWSLFLQSDLRDKLAEMLAELGQVENLEISAKKRDGAVIHLLANVVGKLAPAGGIAELEAQLLDVSEKRKLEQQWGRAQRMEALGRLSCAVAHDFNNLLTAILGYSELLRGMVGADSPYQTQLAEIRKAGRKAASLTRQLLTFGKGKVVEVKVIQLNEVVREMEPLLAQLGGKDIDLVLDLDSGLDPVEVDASQIEQVVLNLVLNARDAMAGGGRLTIRTLNHRVERPFVLHHDSVQPGDYAMLAVRDTGRGIAPEIMDHLFEPFFTTKQPGEGTGLGLSTVYGIVKQNGGFISVYNEPQGGVTFKVSFPAAREAAAGERGDEPGAVAAEQQGRTVLLAEDDDTVRRLMESTFRDHGYAVVAAADGAAALELAESHPGALDLLVTDIAMPRLDGLALANRFAALRPAASILLVSGTAKADSVAVAAKAPVDFLEKPFTPTQLIEKITALLA